MDGGRDWSTEVETLLDQMTEYYLQYTQARLYAPGELAVRRGEVDRSFFIFSRGSFEVLVPGDEGPCRVRVLEPGDLFGEVGIFDGLPRSPDRLRANARTGRACPR